MSMGLSQLLSRNRSSNRTGVVLVFACEPGCSGYFESPKRVCNATGVEFRSGSTLGAPLCNEARRAFGARAFSSATD